MNLRWLVRAARWAHKPPSWGRVKLVFAVIAICLALVAVERFIGWPDWATLNTPRGSGVRLRP
jgi:hypothetical protein